jgi:hypothetical protein
MSVVVTNECSNECSNRMKVMGVVVLGDECSSNWY